MSKIKQLEKELKRLEKIEQERLKELRLKQREAELKRKIKELKFSKIIRAREKAKAIAGKVRTGTRRAIRKLEEYDQQRQPTSRKTKKRKKLLKEETIADRLDRVLGSL